MALKKTKVTKPKTNKINPKEILKEIKEQKIRMEKCL